MLSRLEMIDQIAVRPWVGRFGWVAMIGTVLWSGVRYACADDGVTIA